MSLLDSIASLASGTYTVTRYAAGSLSNGDWTPGSTSTFSITATIQPLLGRDLQVLPEGQHADETRKIYTTTELKTRSPSGVDPDRISINGEDWEVFYTERWPAFGNEHWEVFVSRLATP